MNRNKYSLLVAVSAVFFCVVPLQAAVTGQWDFNADLSATIGNDLEYFDGPGGETSLGTQFGTTASFGLADIAGQAGSVMKMPKNSSSMGLLIRPDLPANGGGLIANQWSMVIDLYYPAASSGTPRAILQIDDPFTNANASELLIDGGNGVGALSGGGVIQPDSWYRILITVDQASDPPLMRKYIDGISAGSEILPISAVLGQIDGRWAILDRSGIFGGDFALMFTDSAGSSEIGYVSSIQFHDTVLSSGYAAALGGPSAGGVPTDVTATAGIDKLSPSPGQTLVFPESPIEIIVVDGDSPIVTDTIKLSVNGQDVTPVITSPQTGTTSIIYDPGLLEPNSVVTARLTFNDPSNNNAENVTDWSFTMAPYNLPPLDLTVDSILYLPFDEVTAVDGDQIMDHSPSQNHGTLFLAEGSGDRKVEGIIGGAIDFTPQDPASDHNRVETTDPYEGMPNSYSCWVKIDENFPDGRVGVTLGNWPTARNVNWEVHSRGLARIYWNNGQVDWKVEGTDLRTGEWEHFAFVRDASKNLFSFYHNGILTATLTAESTDVIPETPPMAGADYRGSGQTFKGQIDEIVVYSKVLTPTEVFQIYANAFEFPVFQFQTPPIISLSPLEDDFNVAPQPLIEVVIDETTSQTQVEQGSVVLMVNGQAVNATTSKENNTVFIRYTPDQSFDPGATVTVNVTYRDTGGNEASKEWSFTTVPPPTIVTNPKSQSVLAGSAVSFSVIANAVPPVAYQWRFAGQPIADATEGSLLLLNVQPSQEGIYDVVITDLGGAVISAAAVLTVSDILPDDPRDSLSIGLAAAWPFDDDFKSLTPGFDAEPMNGASLSTDAKVGSGAVSFSQAQQQFVDVDNQVIADGALTYTVAGWFKVTGGDGRRFLWETSPSNWAISAEITPAGNAKAFVRLADGSSHSADTGIQAFLNEWHHMAVTFDGASGSASIYYDGQLDSVPFAPEFPPGVGTADTTGFHIGSFRGGSGRFFEGLIDDVGVWNRVLRESEILHLSQGNAIPKPDPSKTIAQGLKASWHFDGDFSSITSDFDGEPINGASISTDAKVGSGAASFSQAEQQYVDIDNPLIADGALTYTVAGWFKVTGGDGRRFLWETSPSNWAISAEITPTGNAKAFVRLADSSSHSADTGIQPAIDEWHHLAVTFDGSAGSASIYYDGEMVAVDFSPEFPPGVGTAETAGFHIGSFRGGSGRFFEGLIDEVGVWDRVLNELEIGFLAEGNPIPDPNPSQTLIIGQKASWHFDGDFTASTTGFDGEPINGASISTDAKVGSGAASFSQAEQQYVDIDNQLITDGTLTYTVAGWFKVTGGDGRRFLWETAPTNWAISAEITPTGNAKAFVKLADSSSHSADTGIQPAIDEWHHLAVTFDGGVGSASVYYDGDMVAVDFAPEFPPGVGTAETTGFHIGSFRGGSGRFFEGLIDEVGVWDRVLTELEISFLAEGNLIPNPPVTAAPPPIIVMDPVSQSVLAGSAVSFSVAADTTPPVTYQWRLAGEPIFEATDSSLLLLNVQPSQAGDYDVVITDAGGTVTSNVAVLTVEDILPDNPQDSLSIGLAAAWTFDMDFSSITSDFDGEPINGASISTDARVGSGAASFSQAEQQYVDIDNQVIADGALNYTAAGWFKVTGGDGRRFLWETSPSNWAISAEITPDGNAKAFVRLADSSSHSADTGIQPPIDEWHHLAVTFNGGTGAASVYYDGQLVAVDFAPEFPPGVGTAETTGFHIGSFRGGSGRFFEGLIDEVGVWTRVLNELEIAFLAEGNPIPDPPSSSTSIRITSVQISSGNFQLTWEGGAPPYQVQSRTSVSEGSWMNVGGSTNETGFEEAATGIMQFYQVITP